MESKDNGSNLNFSFAFNDINFSDRVLRIEIEHDEDDKLGFGCTPISWFRRRKETRKKTNSEDAIMDNELCNVEVRTIHISSPILAAKSPFFLKLFSNGMKESQERHATLKIHSSEEVAFMDLLKFMYNSTLASRTTSSLVDLLLVADKFQVSSCIRHCSKLLCDLPMTCESALQFSHLPSSITMADGVQPLTDAAKKYLAVRFKDFTKFEKELLKLPINGIEAVLSSDDLHVTTEDVVYEFVLKWSRKHYPAIKKRREILTTRLASLIHFKYMTVGKLEKILTCNDFDPAYASKVVHDALLFKAESTHLNTFDASRTYTFRQVKVLEFKFPHPHCIVYLDLRKEEFDHLLPTHNVRSEDFHLGGKEFYLNAVHRTMPSDSFGLFLGMCGKQSGSCSVSYEFSARSNPTKEFVSKLKDTSKLTTGGSCYGSSNLFGVSWSQFIAPDSIYFINGVLYLKAEIAMIA